MPSPSALRRSAALLALLLQASLVVNAAAQAPPAELGSTAPRGGPIDDARGYGPLQHPVRGSGGLVVTQSRPASEVGAQVLRDGGNAVDAAVAIGLAEAVTLPRAGNLGGGGYVLIHLAAQKRTVAIDYYPQGPAALTPDYWNDADGKPDRRKAISHQGVAVPGTVAGLYLAHQRYGKLPWRKVVQPAIDLAEHGVRLSDDEAMILQWGRRSLDKDPVARRIFYKPDGSAYQAGELLRQPELAWSLRQIAEGGADAFYRGEIAQRIVTASRAGGGLLTAEDLAGYRAIESEPLWSSYRGVRLALVPPSGSGATLAAILNILEHFPLADYGPGSARATHLIAEATRLAVVDRAGHLGGFPHHRTPARELASKAYAAERAALIRPDTIIPAAQLQAGDPYRHEGKDTTHYTVVDADGNVVANTYTLGANFGASVVPAGTGILLNNSLSNYEWNDRASPSAPAGGKRVISPITPFIAFQGERPWLAAGAPGGGYIIPAIAQFIVNVVDHRLNIAEATARPRINASADGTIHYEQAFSPDTLALLAGYGHPLQPSITQTSIQSIEIRADGRTYGAADTRRPDSTVVGAER
ncbi:MAG: gamma-glutamyltransferase [Pseudomonas sp.]